MEADIKSGNSWTWKDTVLISNKLSSVYCLLTPSLPALPPTQEKSQKHPNASVRNTTRTFIEKSKVAPYSLIVPRYCCTCVFFSFLFFPRPSQHGPHTVRPTTKNCTAHPRPDQLTRCTARPRTVQPGPHVPGQPGPAPWQAIITRKAFVGYNATHLTIGRWAGWQHSLEP